MILIFDGHDGCGKTYIAKETAKLFNIPYFKNVNETKILKTNDTEYATLGGLLLANFIKETGTSVVFDRFYPSELVYTKVFNRKTNDEISWMTEDIMNELGTRIIICYKDLDSYEDRENLIEDKKIRKIKEGFFDFAKKTKCKVLLLNTTSEDLEEQIGTIIDWIGDDVT